VYGQIDHLRKRSSVFRFANTGRYRVCARRVRGLLATTAAIRRGSCGKAGQGVALRGAAA